MALLLDQLQEPVFDHVAQKTLELKMRFANHENISAELAVVAGYAFALHRDLIAGGADLQFTPQMLSNRQVPVTDPEFFRHLHSLEDFTGIVTRLRSEP
jgi:hypothetical protein